MAWFLSEVKNWLSTANHTEKVSITLDEIIEAALKDNNVRPDSTKKAMIAYQDLAKVKLGDKLISEITNEFENTI